MRVLVVDDNGAARRWTRHVLERAGFEVTEADGAERALELVALVHFDAFVLDIALPVVDGVELLELIQRETSAPVVALTGLIDDRVRDAGFDDHLEKPLNGPLLVATLKRLIAERMQ